MVVTADQFVASISGTETSDSMGILSSARERYRSQVARGVRLIDRAGSMHNRKEQARLRGIVEPMREKCDALWNAVCDAQWAGKDERGVWQPRQAEEQERVASEYVARFRAMGWKV